MEEPKQKNPILRFWNAIISYLKNSALGSILSPNTAPTLADLNPDDLRNYLADAAEQAGLSDRDFTDVHGAFEAAQGRVNDLAAKVTAEPKTKNHGLFEVDPEELTPLQTSGNSGGKGKGGKRQPYDGMEK